MQFSVVLSLACVIGYIVLRLKLPLMIAYLLTGVLLSFLNVFDLNHSLVLDVLPEIGIAFVLFLIGMELDLREIKSLGLPITISATTQILITTGLGFVIANRLGFGTLESVYLGLGLAFSSTIVVIKLLLEKKDLSSLYGKLSIGILLIEDIAALIVLMFASLGGSATSLSIEGSMPFFILLAKMAALFAITFVISKFVLEKIFDAVARSTELLFFSAITWCFVFTSIAVLSGFSVVIGSFLAGIALASSPYHFQIQGKIKPLRDFFLTLFFVYLGTQVKLADIISSWHIVLIFSVYAIIVKPLIHSLVLSRFGFSKHTTFQTSLNLSQVSEFSLIVLLVSVQLGLASERALSVMAGAGVLTIIFSATFISASKQIYKIVSPLLTYIPRSKRPSVESNTSSPMGDHIVIIGAHRVGGPVVNYLLKTKIPFLVMDFNPTIVKALREKGVNVIYGDVGDPDVLDSLQMETAKLIISTASDKEDNHLLLEECARRKTKAKILVRSEDKSHEEQLKKMGAHYILMPEEVSGYFLVHELKNHWPKAHFSGLNHL